jgi:hypothetical protein
MSTQASASGISFWSLLGLLFIGLKLGGIIEWSWLWVLSPFWIPFALAFLIVALIGIAYLAKNN